jgi:hypothetical protein
MLSVSELWYKSFTKVQAVYSSDEFFGRGEGDGYLFLSHKQQSNYNIVLLLCFEDGKASVFVSEDGFYGSTSRF